MKTKLLGLCIVLIGFSCSQQDSNEEKNIQVVRDYLEAVNNKDYDKMDELLSDDYLGLGPSIGDSTDKQNAIDSWEWNVENLYEKIEFKRSFMLHAVADEDQIAGEWVSNWANVVITYQDGRGPVEIFLNAIYKIENGKIARSRTFYNEADVYEQLGYRIFPPVRIPKNPENNEE
jgi:ketosteroid isomerase-like protein